MKTNMSNILFITIFLFFTNSIFSQNYQNFAFNGYFRSGFGQNTKGNSMSPFQAPDAEAKYRLGNEAETYLETAFSYFIKDNAGATFDTHILFAMVTPMSESNSYTTTLSLREAFVVARGVIKNFPSAVFWAGQRYYDRYDMHLNDFWYRDMSGFGGGIEGLQIGGAKVAFAYLGGSFDKLSSSGSVYPENNFLMDKSTFDFRLYDIHTSIGNFSFTTTFSILNGDSAVTSKGKITVENSTGWSAGIFYLVPFDKKNESRNLLSLFFGTGAAENYRTVMTTPLGVNLLPGDVYQPDNIRRFRIVNDFLMNFNSKFSMQSAFVYQKLDNGLTINNKYEWISVGARPVFYLNKYFSFATELGWDYTKQDGGDSGSLVKVTFAPQISFANTQMSRPVLRVFVTYAAWSDAFKGKISPYSFGNDTNGLTFGIQAETWW